MFKERKKCSKNEKRLLELADDVHEDRVDRSEAAVSKSSTPICGPTRSRRRFVRSRSGLSTRLLRR
jgi:hypothetical protein